jgi:hypothetical protein
VTRDARWVERHSFYTEYGDWFVLVSVLLSGFGLAALLAGGRRRGESEGGRV